MQPFPKSASALRSKTASAGKAEQETGQLTPTVGEAPVAGGTAGTLSPDDVGLAGTLPAEGLALAAPRPGLVAPAGLRPVVVEEGERDGGVAAEPRRRAGAAGEGRRSHCAARPHSLPPPRNPAGSPAAIGTEGTRDPRPPRSPKYPQLWSELNEHLNQISSLPHGKGRRFCSLRSVQPPKPSVSLDVEAVDATAADEIIGLVQGFLLQVLRAVAVLRHHKDVIL